MPATRPCRRSATGCRRGELGRRRRRLAKKRQKHLEPRTVSRSSTPRPFSRIVCAALRPRIVRRRPTLHRRIASRLQRRICHTTSSRRSSVRYSAAAQRGGNGSVGTRSAASCTARPRRRAGGTRPAPRRQLTPPSGSPAAPAPSARLRASDPDDGLSTPATAPRTTTPETLVADEMAISARKRA